VYLTSSASRNLRITQLTTLLVFRYFYQSSPFKIQRALTSLLDSDFSIGLSFQQQVRGDASVPDALIAQEPIRIFIETKRGGAVDTAQIRHHFESIAHRQARTIRGEGTLLIVISKEMIPDSDRRSLAAEAGLRDLTFAAVTFSQIVESLRA